MPTAIAAIAMLLVPGPPQDEPASPGPAPELERFAPMLGRWRARGTMRVAPAAEAAPWTSTIHAHSILGGQAVQVDEVRETPLGRFGFLTIHGYDRELDRPFCAWVGTDGPGAAEAAWVDGSTFVGAFTRVEDGVPVAYRWSVRFEGDAADYAVDRAAGSEPFFELSRSRAERLSGPAVLPGWEHAPSEAMRALEPLIGAYSVEGKVSMPGMDMDVTAEERNDWMFGGAVIATHVSGQPGDYAADVFLTWDVARRRYSQLFVTNMGEIGLKHGRLADGKLVFVDDSPMMGMAGAGRSVVVIEGGAVARSWTDRMNGAGEPARIFEATYRRAGAER